MKSIVRFAIAVSAVFVFGLPSFASAQAAPRMTEIGPMLPLKDLKSAALPKDVLFCGNYFAHFGHPDERAGVLFAGDDEKNKLIMIMAFSRKKLYVTLDETVVHPKSMPFVSDKGTRMVLVVMNAADYQKAETCLPKPGPRPKYMASTRNQTIS